MNRRDSAIAIRGLKELQAALKRSDEVAAKALRTELRGIADTVRDKARGNVTHKTGRHGGADVPRLGPSIKTSVTNTGASIYSKAPHAIVQDTGGQVGRGKSTLLKRASVSRYMTKAVAESEGDVERAMDRVLDDIGKDFNER
jgi:hypothetical protein